MDLSDSTKRRKSGEGSKHQDRKMKRSKGSEYNTLAGKIVKSKEIPVDEIICKCTYQCKDIAYQQKLSLFEDFYALADNIKQNSFLLGLITVCPIKRRRHGHYEDPTESRRQATICFSLPNGSGEIVQVCKKTFIHIFGITSRRIETLVKHKKTGAISFTEKRGNKTMFRKFSRDDKNTVIQHISSFPREISHYGRMKSNKEYLSQDLNINRMYTAFKMSYPNSHISYRYYYKTVKAEFPQLKFHHPRSDTCQTCDLLNMQCKADSNNKVTKAKLDMHHRKAEKAMKEMKEDNVQSQRSISDTCTISMDLQQVLSLPALTHSQMYYLRQLSCYNFNIHVGDTNKANMFLWHEGMSGRGGNEIASCILKGVTNGMTGKNRLIVWSDNCAGQNKNKMLLFLWIYLITNGYFQEINQKFLVSGHSFLSCDRDFAQIEKRKRLEKCEVPLDLVKLITTVTPKNPFNVIMMNVDDFIDFKSLSEMFLQTSKIKISKAQWIKVSKEDPSSVYIRETLNEMEDWKSFKILKKNVSVDDIKNVTLTPLDCSTNKIKPEKKKDLEAILNFVKPENREFFENLIK